MSSQRSRGHVEDISVAQLEQPCAIVYVCTCVRVCACVFAPVSYAFHVRGGSSRREEKLYNCAKLNRARELETQSRTSFSPPAKCGACNTLCIISFSRKGLRVARFQVCICANSVSSRSWRLKKDTYDEANILFCVCVHILSGPQNPGFVPSSSVSSGKCNCPPTKSAKCEERSIPLYRQRRSNSSSVTSSIRKESITLQ